MEVESVYFRCRCVYFIDGKRGSCPQENFPINTIKIIRTCPFGKWDRKFVLSLILTLKGKIIPNSFSSTFGGIVHQFVMFNALVSSKEKNGEKKRRIRSFSGVHKIAVALSPLVG